MAFWNSTQILNINEGTSPNDGTGDNIRDAFNKVDENFANISIQLAQFNQDWTNANVEYNTNLNFANIANLFVANSTGTTSNFTGNSSSGNIIANTGLYSSGTSHFRGNLYLTGNILPTAYGVYDLGSPTTPFGNLYVENTISTNQIYASSDAGMLLVHANATIGMPVDVGIMGNISTVAGANSYSFMGFQASTNSFKFATTPLNTSAGNSKVSAFTLSNVQAGSMRISNSTASTSTTTGAVVVVGGVGVGGTVTVGGNVDVSGHVNVTGNLYSDGYQTLTTNSAGIGNIFNGTSSVFLGNTVFPAATPSVSYTSGAIVVPYGGVGVYGNVVAGGFVGTLHGAQNSITSLTVGGNVTIATGQMNIRAVQATNVNTTDLTATGTVSFAGVTLSGLANVTAAVLNSTGNLNVSSSINATGNVAGSYFLGNGALLTGLTTNTQFVSLAANVTAANAAIQTTNANLGSYQTWANSTIQTTNANIGAYHTWANAAMQTDDANIGAYQTWANSTIQTTNANSGAYQTWANANATTQATSINSINANVGAYYSWANSTIQTTNANLGAYQTYANTTFGTSNYSNVNLAGYLSGTAYIGNFSTPNAVITSCDTTTFDATTGVVTNFSATNVQITSERVTTGVVTNFSSGNVYISGGYITNLANISTTGTNGNATISGNINLTGSIIPSANVTSNLGDSTHWFGTLYGVSTQAKYADLAERYVADADYAPGTVVVFGGEQEITLTEEFSDSRVAGAISTEPAYLMNAAAVGLPVALRGRVPCKVVGPVTKGDLLVTAGARPGYAVSVGSNKTHGASIFAKALVTDLSEGEKIIEVVII